MTASIAIESLLEDDANRHIVTAHSFSSSLHPAEGRHVLTLEALAAPGVTFCVARRAGGAAGTGALIRHDPGARQDQEVCPEPVWRGSSIGCQILADIEAALREAESHRLAVETGIRKTQALGLYRGAKRADCPRFVDCRPAP